MSKGELSLMEVNRHITRFNYRTFFPYPQAMRAFIEANFKMMDLNGDGVIGVEEFRYNCIQRLATDDIKVVDDAFNQLLNVSQKTKRFSALHDNKLSPISNLQSIGKVFHVARLRELSFWSFQIKNSKARTTNFGFSA